MGKALSSPSETEEEATAKLVISIVVFSIIIIAAISISIHRKINQDMNMEISNYILSEDRSSITLEISARNNNNLYYKVKHQNENIFVDITPSALVNSQPLGNTIFLSIKEGESNICIRTIGEPYKLYLHRDKETGEWEISDWWDKTGFLMNNPFLF
jgi:hypothetical protein